MDTQANSSEPNVIGFDKPNTSSAPTAVLWITFVLALGLTVFLFMASRSTQNALEAKMAQKTELDGILASSSYSDVEQKANSFKEAFDILNTLSTERFAKQSLLAELYTNITNDVLLNNLAIGADGTLSIDGSTGSYRAVADMMTGLKQYKRISDLKLMNSSLDLTEGVAENRKVIFTISAKLDMTKEKPIVKTEEIVTDEDELSSELDDTDYTSSDYEDTSTADTSYDSYSSDQLTPDTVSGTGALGEEEIR